MVSYIRLTYFAILECSLNVSIVNKTVFTAPELREKCAVKSEVFPSLPKILRNDVTETIFGGNFKHQYLPHYPIFLGKTVQTWSVEPTKYFDIYFGYIRRLFPRWVGPFKLDDSSLIAPFDTERKSPCRWPGYFLFSEKGWYPGKRCEICGRSFNGASSLRNHRAMHRGETSCPVCLLVFSQKGNMKRHLKQVHGRDDWSAA